MKKVIVEMDENNNIYVNGNLVGTAIGPVQEYHECELSSQTESDTVVKLAAAGYSADDILKLKMCQAI